MFFDLLHVRNSFHLTTATALAQVVNNRHVKIRARTLG